MVMGAAAEAAACAAAGAAAFVCLILWWRCWPRWRIRLVWTGGSLWAGGSSPHSTDTEGEPAGVTEEDLKVLLANIDLKDGGPPWKLTMDRVTPTLSFRAWCRDPKFGPTQYRSQTIFENMEPELLRDFFSDDEFRIKWDDMLVYFRTLQEYPHNGTVIIHLIRKLPFICTLREYIIGHRMWVSGSTYYCVSKSIQFPGIPRRQRPRRVDIYYSSWRIRAVKSRNGGHSNASEVLLFHFEDMGVHKPIAKVAIQRGMWRLVEKLEQGARDYQISRLNGVPPSRHALLSRIATRIPDENVMLDDAYLSEDQLMEGQFHGFTLGRKKLVWWFACGILISCGLRRRELGEGLLFYIIQGIKNILIGHGDDKFSFFPDHGEIAKRVQDLRSASKQLDELMQKARGLATAQSQVIGEQIQASEL